MRRFHRPHDGRLSFLTGAVLSGSARVRNTRRVWGRACDPTEDSHSTRGHFAAIRAVAAGDALVDPAVTGRLLQRWSELEGRMSPSDDLPAPVATLTGREREILIGLASGRSNRELAAELFLSEATVKSHVSNLLLKLGVRSRVQAVILAYELALVRPGGAGNR